MQREIRFYEFLITLILFIFSILILIRANNFYWLLVGWDGLGISSFFLIIFYNNINAINAGLLTLMINRLGDLGLIRCFFIFENYGLCNIFMITHSGETQWDLIFIGVLILSAFTKSAQIPFCAWLPAAIAAPTPVSSLVHSSTLVTAGIFLIYRFSRILSNWTFFLFVFGRITTFVARFAALTENDIKKIVALSTLSHLGIIVRIIGLSSPSFAFIHLIFHAFFKALLFIALGLTIHLNSNYQDLRKVVGLFFLNSLNTAIILVAILSLCGVPFLSGYFSKDIFLEIILISDSRFLRSIIILSLCLSSFGYSIRLIYSLILQKTRALNLIWYENLSSLLYYYYSMAALLVAAIFLGKSFFYIFSIGSNVIFLEGWAKLGVYAALGLVLWFFAKLVFLFKKRYSWVFPNSYSFLDFLPRTSWNKYFISLRDFYVKFDKTEIDFYSKNWINMWNTYRLTRLLQNHSFLKLIIARLIFLSTLRLILL